MTYGAWFSSASAVDVYTELLVPRVFGPWAELLLDRLAPARGCVLLDVACGPGTVARAAAPRLGSTGRIVATDFSETMIAMARALPADGDDLALIEFRVSPAAPLSVEDRSVDAVTCQQGLQFFPDRAAALEEMRRVLRPGGRVALACWASIERCTPWAALERALAAVLPQDRVELVRMPFTGPGPQATRDILAEAGFTSIAVDESVRPVVFEGGVQQWLRVLATLPVAPDVARLPDEELDRLTAAGERETAGMRGPRGEVRGELTAVMATAAA